MLFQCCVTVFDAGPTIKQHWSVSAARSTWQIEESLKKDVKRKLPWHKPMGQTREAHNAESLFFGASNRTHGNNSEQLSKLEKNSVTITCDKRPHGMAAAVGY